MRCSSVKILWMRGIQKMDGMSSFMSMSFVRSFSCVCCMFREKSKYYGRNEMNKLQECQWPTKKKAEKRTSTSVHGNQNFQSISGTITVTLILSGHKRREEGPLNWRTINSNTSITTIHYPYALMHTINHVHVVSAVKILQHCQCMHYIRVLCLTIAKHSLLVQHPIFFHI